MNKQLNSRTIKGKEFEDDRGTLKFFNDFDLKAYRRFYQIELTKKNMIRAFHGHMKESKAVYVVSGSLLLCLVKLTDSKNPSKKNKVKQILLNSSELRIFLIPPEHANGIMSKERHTNVIFFSDKTLLESKKDDYRFPFDYWGEEVWEK